MIQAALKVYLASIMITTASGLRQSELVEHIRSGDKGR